MFALKVDGGEDLARKLNALPDALQKPVLVKALKAGGEPIRSAAALHMARSGDEDHAADHVGMTPSTSGHSIAIGPTSAYFYWLFQEYGTVHVPAQPALRPAFDTQGVRALGLIGQQLWAAVKAQAETGSGGLR